MSFKFSINGWVIFIVILLQACDSIEKPIKRSLHPVKPIDIHELAATYISSPVNGEAYCELSLDTNFHYVYRGSGCLGGLIDSGRFKINVDTIEFSSSLRHKYGHDNNRTKITCLNDEVLIFLKGKLFPDRHNRGFVFGSFSSKNFLLRKDLTVSLTEMLDTNGNGKAVIYNGSGFVFSSGEYRNFKLVEGTEYKVTHDKMHIHIDYYYKGRIYEDTIVKYSSMYREQEAKW